MKRVIKSATDSVTPKMEKILKSMKTLLDDMENTPSGTLDSFDLGPLYEELIEAIPDVEFQLNDAKVRR